MNISEEKIIELKKDTKQYLYSIDEKVNAQTIENTFNIILIGYIKGMNDALKNNEITKISLENSAINNFQDNYSY